MGYALAMTFLATFLSAWMLLAPQTATAQDGLHAALPERKEGNVYFKLATGGIGGNYYPIGGLLAQGLSNPAGSRPCAEGGACGVPGLVVIPLSANASLSNMAALESGVVDGAIVQSDAAFWGYTGSGLFDKAHTNVRFVATLFSENLHLVARTDSGIKSIRDLRGHLVGVGLNGSGTLEDARAVLSGENMSLNEIVPQYLTFEESIDRLEKGLIDALFFVAPTPSPQVKKLMHKGITPVPIAGDLRQTLLDRFLFFDKVTLPAGTYGLKKPWETVGLGAQLLVRADLPDKLVYDLTTALWAPHTQTLLRLHPKGKEVTTDTAFFALAVPMHPGAARYYREKGLSPTPTGQTE
ncbi:MAG: TAXI family TRAP transporter solute-binding subunit [Proteobacteria bacterium]|nr:TAXI family TRAP transporter solute-binding subunit [Pseudomonadota bacterium]